MSDDAKQLIADSSKDFGTIESREQRERARVELGQRYLNHLAGVFAGYGVTDPAELAAAAVAALFDWRDVDTGDPCECGCHFRPRNHTLHEGGFGCDCTKPAVQRRRALDEWPASIGAFENSPEGRQLKERHADDDTQLQAWLGSQPDVVVSSRGGAYPEQWEGTVDGHSYYFRERWCDWSLELDLWPTGRSGRVITGAAGDGEITTHEVEECVYRSGDVIAAGTTAAEGYGENPLQRAQFIIDTIRTQLARQSCTHHQRDLATIRTVLGDDARWYPSCGARLTAGAAHEP